jgi:tetratricopeptide (TPR) repeat protein
MDSIYEFFEWFDGKEMVRLRVFVVHLAAVMALGSLNGQVADPAVFGIRPPAFRQLVQALEDTRPFVPRLAPWRRWSRCGALPAAGATSPEARCKSGLFPSRDIQRLGRRIEDDARERPDDETLHALGIWRLLSSSGADRDMDVAVAALRQATAYLPSSGDAWNDLAVAYYVRGRERESPEDLVRSLAACDRALRVKPDLRPALFNRSLVLAALYLRGEAARAMQQFLIAGDSPEWAAEAHERLIGTVLPRQHRALPVSELLSSQGPQPSPAEVDAAVAVDPVDAIRFAELKLLGDPVSPRSKEDLFLARGIAAVLQRRFGDRMLADEVAAWARAAHGKGEASRWRSLAAGYESFREGVALYETLDTARAGRCFTRAVRELGKGGSPLHLWSAYWRAVCDYWNGDSATAESALRALRIPAGSKSRILEGYTALMLGLIAADRSAFDGALEWYLSALASFEQAGAGEAAGFSRVLLAQVFERVNDPHAGWQHLHRGLAGAQGWRNQRWRHALFAQAADSVRALGEPEAALYFQDASLKAALLSGQAASISEEYASRSLALTRLGRLAGAAADAASARHWLGRVVDQSVRRRSEDSVLVAEAHVAGRERPGVAVEALDRAIQDRRRQGTTALLAELELEKGRLLTGLGRLEDAEESLRTAVEVIETASAGLRAEQRRSAYFTVVREVFDEIIRFEIDVRKDPRAALVFADRARVHEFLTARVNRGRRPTLRGLAALQGRLGRQDGVLVYRMLEDRLLIWLVKRDEVVFQERNLPAGRLATLVDDLGRSLHGAQGSAIPFGQAAVVRWRDALYAELMAPVAPGLAGVERLWIVPDRALFRLPFAALADPESGRFLCEGRRLAKALTIGLGEESPRPAPPPSTAGLTSILAIGDPAFSALHALPRLPRAGREASLAAAAYPRATLLLGADATRRRLLAELDQNGVFLFAGHALLNREAPDLSMLVLAPDADGKNSGSLYASDIEKLVLKRTRIVLLSACGDAIEEEAADGFSGLARPFLAAGVPVVVSSLWRIDDAMASRFFSAFHHLLRVGAGDPLEALQSSQRANLDQGNLNAQAVYRWAAFEAYVARPQP